MLITGSALFLASSLTCGLAWSAGALITARVVQGSSAAMMTPAALAILTDTFPAGAERNKALAWWSGAGGLGATGALLIGGPVTQALGWEWIFFLNVPVAVILLAFAPLLLREGTHRDQAGGHDPAGTLTITAALVLLTAAIVQAPAQGWTSGLVLGMLLGAAVLAGLFIAAEQRSPAPLLPLRIFRSRLFTGGNLAMLLFAMTALGTSTTVSSYAQRVLGYTPMRFGLGMLAMTIMTLAGTYAAQAGVTRAGPRPVAAAGMALMGLGALLLSRAPVHGAYLSDLFPALLVFGLGLGAGPVAAISAAMSAAEPEMTGVASGVTNAVFQIGGALGAAIVSSVVGSRAGSSPGPTQLADGSRAGFISALIIALTGLCATLLLLRPAAPQTDSNTPTSRQTEQPEGSPRP